MSMLINNIIEFLLAFMEVVLCYFVVCNTVLKKCLLNKKINFFFISVSIIVGILLYTNRKIVFVSYTMILFCVIVTCISIWIVKRSEIFVIISVVATYYLIMALFEFFLAFMSMMFLNQKFDQMVYYYATSFWKNVIYLGAILCFMLIFLCFRERQKKYFIDVALLKNILLIFDIFLYVIFRQYQNLLDDMAAGDQKMFGTGAGVSLLVIIVIIGACGIVFLKYKMIQEENRNYLIRDDIYRKNYNDVEQVLKINSQRIHDMKNHFAVIKELCRQESLVDLEKYVDNIYKDYFEIEYQSWTGNRILDIILNQKKEIAKRKEIDFNINTMLIPVIKLNEIEICSLFGNLLDNAIEACEKIIEKEKFIDVKIDLQREMLFISIKNSIASKPIIEKGEFITSKDDKHIHGFGLKSVNRIVKKYEGIISYKIEEKIFEMDISFFDMINI